MSCYALCIPSGGEESIRVWRWNEVTAVANAPNDNAQWKPLSELICPQKAGPRGATPALCETNGVAVDSKVPSSALDVFTIVCLPLLIQCTARLLAYLPLLICATARGREFTHMACPY